MAKEDIRFSGKLFEQTKRSFANAMQKSMEDVGVLTQDKVRSELYPTHGFRTGHLWKNVWTETKNLRTVVDARGVRRGANLHYANWVEGIDPKNSSGGFAGFQMFKQAYQWLKKKPKEVEDIMRFNILKEFK